VSLRRRFRLWRARRTVRREMAWLIDEQNVELVAVMLVDLQRATGMSLRAATNLASQTVAGMVPPIQEEVSLPRQARPM
jgi:hypothetical protein